MSIPSSSNIHQEVRNSQNLQGAQVSEKQNIGVSIENKLHHAASLLFNNKDVRVASILLNPIPAAGIMLGRAAWSHATKESSAPSPDREKLETGSFANKLFNTLSGSTAKFFGASRSEKAAKPEAAPLPPADMPPPPPSQGVAAGPPPPADMPPPPKEMAKIIAKKEKQLSHIGNELKTTERSFLNSMKSGSLLLNQMDIGFNFLREVNADLSEAAGRYKKATVSCEKMNSSLDRVLGKEGSSSINVKDLVGVYSSPDFSDYTENLANCANSYGKLCKDQSLMSETVKTSQLDGTVKSEHLNTALITAVQRMPRHEMMLKEILKNTVDLEEKKLLEQAIGTVQKAAKRINEAI